MGRHRCKLLNILGHWRWFFKYVVLPCSRTRWAMPKVMCRVRNKARSEKLKVLFVVGSLSKWKSQSLFDMMKASDRFDPSIALIICDADLSLSEDVRLKEIESRREYFTAKGMRCEAAYLNGRGNIPLSEFSPDLVFYSQPWSVEPASSTYETAKSALAFYIQYYITLCETQGSIDFASYSPFYRHLCTYFAQTPLLADLYRKNQGVVTATREFVGLGNPMLDQFAPTLAAQMAKGKDYVIYAPHWTIMYPGSKNYDNCATFFETGGIILEYAQQHPEINWVFKPHPALRSSLERSGLWSADRITEYYESWERIGVACYGEYVAYFNDSKALITDSVSFLYEYVCTGRPIIRLMSQNALLDSPQSACGRLFGTYYQVYTKEELYHCFENVIERGLDPHRDKRLGVAHELGLFNSNAAKKIYDYLMGLFW